MKKLLIGFVLVGFTSLGYAAEKEEKACFHVEGMTCTTCTLTLKTAVKKLNGIKSVNASVENKSAVVSFNPEQTTKKQIKEKINLTGYKASSKSCEKNKG